MELPKKEFYFARHGEVNIDPEVIRLDPPLTEKGKEQALALGKKVADLPIATICHSPLNRAVETKELACAGMSQPHVKIENLKECSLRTWQLMTQMETDPSIPLSSEVRSFQQQALEGVVEALSHPAPALIIAHGGVHFILAHSMGFAHEKKIGFCSLLRFVPTAHNWEISFL